ncbi:hypothetical protein [Sphingomonas sp. NFX23]
MSGFDDELGAHTRRSGHQANNRRVEANANLLTVRGGYFERNQA